MKNDKIQQILEEITPPAPSEIARKAALAVALTEFDKNNQKTTQGSTFASRLMDMINQLDRRINMKKAYYYGGSLTAIALTLSVLTYSEYTNSIRPFSQIGSSLSAPASNSFKPVRERNTRNDIVMDVPVPVTPMDQEVSGADKNDHLADGSPKAKSESKKMVVSEQASPEMDVAPLTQKAMPIPAAPPTIPMPSMTPPAPGTAGNGAGFSNTTSYDYNTQPEYVGNDKFEKTKTNPVKLVGEEPVSTFSIDVDTSSYSFVRRQLNMGALPQKDAVRVEEMINYFDYNYPLPESKSQPFRPSITVLPSPWHKGNKLVHIGIKGYDIAQNEKPRSNLVFLIDTSGSMMAADRLPLVINSLQMLVNTLEPNDTVSIVTYAGYAGTALEPTKIKDKTKILAVLQNLQSGGSTAGGEGIMQAYALAEKNFDKSGVNRVILATDGDFNVGITDPNALQTLVENKRDTGIFLSVLGVGEGNYNDAMMQKLAQNGNGNAAYIDNINEARKVLVQEASSTLFTIAKDVKIQVEFNKDKVSEYRLVGYETRLLNREDFNNDKVDAGEIGSGHAVTAIYEITPKGEQGVVDEPRYGKDEKVAASISSKDEYGFLKVRYKLPKDTKSQLLNTPISSANEVSTVEKAPQDVRFATSVAAFGELLHGDTYIGDYTYGDVAKLASGAKGEDKFGYRAEFINLVKTAQAIPTKNNPPAPPPAPADYR